MLSGATASAVLTSPRSKMGLTPIQRKKELTPASPSRSLTMPDVRRGHFTYPPGPSLLNQPVQPFRSAATSLYTERGPARASPDYGARKPNSTPPESIQHHVDDCLARIANLSSRQRNAVRAEVLRM